MYTLEDRQLDPQSRLYMITKQHPPLTSKRSSVRQWLPEKYFTWAWLRSGQQGENSMLKKKCLICSKEAMYNKSPASFISFYSPNLLESCLQRALRAALMIVWNSALPYLENRDGKWQWRWTINRVQLWIFLTWLAGKMKGIFVAFH